MASAARAVALASLAALLLGPALGGCAPVAAPADAETARADAADARRAESSRDEWIEATLAGLSLEQKVGQMLFPRITGEFAGIDGDELRSTREWIRRYHIGGLEVRFGTPTETAAKLNVLQSVAQLPLLVATDVEALPTWQRDGAGPLPRGRGGAGTTAFPSSTGLAATGEPAHARVAGRITAREARAVGVHWLLGPTVDVPGDAPEAQDGIRDHVAAPATLAHVVADYIRGANEGGVLTTARHFPGRGAARFDVGLGMAVLADDSALSAGALPRFMAAVHAGAGAVMLGHIAVPAMTDGRLEPASLTPVLGGTLIRRHGFDGIIVTDAMTDPALRRLAGYSPAEIIVRAVLAGADVVLAPPDVEVAHRALVAAVRSGRIREDSVDASVRRVLRAKAAADLHRQRVVPLDAVAHLVASAEHARTADEIAAATLVLARDEAGLVPLDPRRTGAVSLIAFSAAGDTDAGLDLAAALRAIYGEVAYHRLDESLATDAFEEALRAARKADAVIFATYVGPPDGAGEARLPGRALALHAQLAAAGARTITVGFADPSGIAAVRPSTLLLAWQPHGRTAARAVARAIAGLADIGGRTPVELPLTPRGSGQQRQRLHFGLAFAAPETVGMSTSALQELDAIIEVALLDGAAPGAAIAIGRKGRIVKLRGYGSLDWRDGFGVATDSSLYDLASLTKVIATTTLTMMLVDEGLLDLDAPLSQFLPEWRPDDGREHVTLRHLLLHNSGLPAYSALYSELQGSDAYVRRIGGLALQYEPGSRTVYSDFGPILLAAILERLTGHSLEELFARRLAGPLGLRETLFNPLGTHAATAYGEGGELDDDLPPASAALLERIAPTELDTIFRHGHLHGRVHDENAYALGGVAGHAGLFGSARDLARFAQMLLNGGFFDDRRYVRRSTVLEFTRRQGAASSRALGWDTPAAASPAGDFFSAQSFGHTGFTGTSIWIDPERDLFLVLLTNRVNPTRANQKHIALRRAVANAVQRAIMDAPLVRRPDS